MKRFKSLILSLMAISFAINASAYDFEVDGIYYNILSMDDMTCQVTYNPNAPQGEKLSYYFKRISGNVDFKDYNPSYEGNVIVPKSVEYKGRKFTVTQIGAKAFLGCKKLTGLSLPSTINKIYYAKVDQYSTTNYLYAGPFDSSPIENMTVGIAFLLGNTISYNKSDGRGTDWYYVNRTYQSIKTLVLSNDFKGEIAVDFSEFGKLKEIYSYSSVPPSFSSGKHFSNSQLSDLTVYVPEEYYETYKTADVWKNLWELKPMVKAKSVSLNYSNLELEPYENKQLLATVLPEDTYNKDISWSSSDPTVATVDDNGVVTGVSKGDAVISVKTLDGSEIVATCKVHVDLLVKSLELTEHSMNILLGKQKKMEAKVLPENAYVKTLKWTSSDESIVTVDETGVITAKAVGNAYVFASTTDGSNISDKCLVLVLKPVERIEFPESPIELMNGETKMLYAKVYPEDATIKDVEWKSSNPYVATVSPQGIVTGILKGKVTITATATDGTNVSGSCEVNVELFVNSVALSEHSIRLGEGSQASLTADVSPINAKNRKLEWSSSNEGVASVDENGVVYAKSVGEALIVAKTTDGSNISDECLVTVYKPVERIELFESSMELMNGDSAQLYASVYPEDATLKDLEWSTSNPYVATVSPEGLVTAISKGKVKITATAKDGSNVSGSCDVNVELYVNSIVLSEHSIKLSKGKQTILTAEILPQNAKYKTLEWRSTDETVASVTDKGVVIAKSVGTAEIIATTTDGSKLSDKCSVIVVELVNKIELNKTSVNMNVADIIQLETMVYPETATIKELEWTSENTNVATVDENGIVCAVSPGSTKIVVKATDGSGVMAECLVTVSAITYNVMGVCYQKNSSTTLKVVSNESEPYSGAVAIPEKVSINGNKYDVSAIDSKAFENCTELTKIALPKTINSIGESAFVGCTALEYLYIESGSKLNINVDDAFSSSPIKTLYQGGDGITFNSTNSVRDNLISLTLGNTVSSLPPDTVFNTLESFVLEDGGEKIVEPKEYVSVEYSLNYQETIKEDKVIYKFGYSVNTIHLSTILEAFKNKQLKYFYNGREFEFYSDGEEKPTYEKKPTIAGDRYREFGCVDEYFYYYHDYVTKDYLIENVATDIKLNHTEYNLYKDESLELAAKLSPSNVSYSEVKWSSSDESVAYVDMFGKVWKVGDGEAVITATTKDGSNLSASCKIGDAAAGISNPNINDKNEKTNVYNLSGQKVKTIENKDDLKTLPKGIYIVNGKKFMVK